jgi:hypothetical protein
LKGRESSPVRWEGPPTDNRERSGKVKDTGGSFFGEGHRVRGKDGMTVRAQKGGDGNVRERSRVRSSRGWGKL